MKIPKQFIYFLVIVQIVLTLGHLALYKALVFFFPFFAAHAAATLIILVVLSISFLSTTLLSFKGENALMRLLYIAASVWVPAWFYFLLAAAVSSIIAAALRPVNMPAMAIGLFSIALATAVYGTINARYLQTIQLDIELPNLPGYWKGKTAVLVTDLHLGHILRQGFAKKITDKINTLQPDIVFIAGDFYDGVHTDFPGLAESFKNIHPLHGTYFCSGNHELYAGMKECEEAISQAGITILNNRKIDINGLQVAGIAYEHERMPDIEDKLRGLNIDRQKPSILLKHVPLQVKEVAAAGISLQLSGHTHQGQVWPGRIITKRYFKGFDYGYKKFENLQLYISSGAGTWGPPMRSFTKSEIVRITFE